MLEEGAASISIIAPKPEVMRGVDAKRMSVYVRANNEAMRPFNMMTQSSQVSWSIALYPTVEWASVVFPDLPADEAVTKLWESLKIVTRMNLEDPTAFWKGHVEFLMNRTQWLNERQFTRLEYKSEGTDLTVELPKQHVWVGGGLENAKGTFFLPNIPTEEVFTTPYKYGVNGVVRGTKPITQNGQFIDGFTLTFKDGRVVEATAEVGQDLLQSLLNTDEASRYVGEVALVPHSSPISQVGVVFQNTLLDENAACHFALGMAYPMCIEGGTSMTAEEREQRGSNTSLIHADFMMGSADLNVTAYTQDGEAVPLLINGEWVI
jgi:aminopeptidase